MRNKYAVLLTRAIASTFFLIPAIGFTQPAERPIFKIGDSWAWVTTDNLTKREIEKLKLTVTEVNVNGIQLKKGDEAGASVTWDKEGRFVSDKTTGASWDLTGGTPWPLAIGKRWKTEYSWVNKEGGTGKTIDEAEVVSVEDVTTSVGTFKAIKYVQKGYFNNRTTGFSGHQSSTRWYVPELRTLIKYTYDDGYNRTTSELISAKVE